MRSPVIFVSLLMLGAIWLLQREVARGTFDEIERQTQQWLYRISGTSLEPAAVILVELKDGDLPVEKRFFDHWPLEPLDYALILERLAEYQPRALAVTSLLEWPKLEVLDAFTLSERLAYLPHAVLSFEPQWQENKNEEASTEKLLEEKELLFEPLLKVTGDREAVPEFNDRGRLPALDLAINNPLGFIRIDLGEGPVYDVKTQTLRVPLMARYGDCLLPSLFLQTLIRRTKMTAAQVTGTLGQKIVIGSLHLPIDKGGWLTLPWDESRAEKITTLDASALLLDVKEDGKLMGAEAEAVKKLRETPEKIIVLGNTTAQAAGLTLAQDRALPDAVWLAQALAQVTSGRLAWAVSGLAWWVSLLWTIPMLWWIRPRRKGAWPRTILAIALWTSTVVLFFLLTQWRLPWLLASGLLMAAVGILSIRPADQAIREIIEIPKQKE